MLKEAAQLVEVNAVLERELKEAWQDVSGAGTLALLSTSVAPIGG